MSKDVDIVARADQPKRWRDIWSAGHSVSGVSTVLLVAQLIARSTRDSKTLIGKSLR
jgi:nitronate monooxygenase